MKTSEPIVLTIFGDERSVVSMHDLEAAAKAIHSKAVRESKTSANPSTLGGEIEGQIRVINAESGPSRTEASRTFNEMSAWLDELRDRSQHLDDSTPAKAWDLMLRAFALQTALKADGVHPGFRATATTNLRRLIRDFKRLRI